MLLIKIQNKNISVKKENGKYVFNGWITVKRNHDDEEETGRHLFVKDGETPKEAMKRSWGVDLDKRKQETKKKAKAEKKDKPVKEFTDLLNSDVAKKYEELTKQAVELNDRIKKGLATSFEINNVNQKFNDAKFSFMQAKSKAITEVSQKIKNIIKDYSKNNDSLISELQQVQNPYEEIDNEIKKLKEQFKNVDANAKNNNIDRFKAMAEKITINIKLEAAREQKKALLNDYVLANAKILNKKDTSFKVNFETKKMLDDWQKLSDCLNGFCGNDTLPNNDAVTIKKIRKGARANQSSKDIHIASEDSLDVVIHEYMHFLEAKNPRILLNSLAFAKMRTEGTSTESLVSITGNKAYQGERAKKDSFFSPYCGKIYSVNGDFTGGYASEIMSMGIQRIFSDPVKFAEEDREYFDFCIANIKGDI